MEPIPEESLPHERLTGTYSTVEERDVERKNAIATLRKSIASLQHSLLILTILGAVISVVATVSLGLVISHVVRYSEGMKHWGRTSYDFCLPCENITLSSPLENEFLQTVARAGDNRDVCCALNGSESAILVERFFVRAIRIAKARGKFCNGRVDVTTESTNSSVSDRGHWMAAHVVGEGGKVGTVESPLFWTSTGPLAYTRGVRYRAHVGRLIVQQDGVYYVYSQLQFTEAPSNGGIWIDDRRQIIIHSIMRGNIYYNDGEPELLLRKCETKGSAPSNTSLEQSSYLGGAMTLRAQDEIYVETSLPELVHPKPQLTYFGLYKIY